MKPRKTKDFRDLPVADLELQVSELQETLAKQKFQHALKQLHDTDYLRILKKDIARMKTLINERKRSS